MITREIKLLLVITIYIQFSTNLLGHINWQFQGMYLFVPIVDDSLILEWAANRADSAINETPAVIQRRTLLVDCICICSQRGMGEEGLVKVRKVVAMFILNPI